MKIYVDLDHVDITEYTGIESGEYNTNKINFIFTPEYKDLVKVAIFGCKLDTEEPKFYKVYLTDDSCYIPSEVLEISDVITIGCYGYKASGETLNLRYSPTPVKVIVYEGSFREGAENSSPLTPTEVEQIMERIATLDDEVDDLDGRVTVLEGKSCDLDVLKTRVDTLEADVTDLDSRLDVVEGDLADTYSKSEVDTLLSGKVDTTTFNASQEAQDEKINYADLIISQFPKVTDTGTTISLTPTYKGKLESTVKGNTSQNTLTGKNIANITDVSASGNDLEYNSTTQEITIKSGQSGSDFLLLEQIQLEANTEYIFEMFFKTSSNTANSGSIVLQDTDNTTIVSQGSYTMGSQTYLGLTFTPTDTITLKRIQIYNSSTKPLTADTYCYVQIRKTSTTTGYEPYTNGASPNPNYPQNIKVVTGDNTITISNADNTHSTSHPISLGSLELCKIGTYQDYIYKDSGKWYKYGAIDKYQFTGIETLQYNSNYNGFRYQNNDMNLNSSNPQNDLICSHFVVANARNQVAGTIPTIRVYNSTTDREYLFMCDGTSDLTTFKNWLLSQHNNNNPVTIRYKKYEPSTTEITDTTLIQQLNNLEKAMSENGTTNISSTYESGNSQMIITASALKQLS